MNIKNQLRALSQSVNLSVVRFAAVAALGIVGLSGCGSGAGTADNPIPETPDANADYSGPPAAGPDIQAFFANFYSKALLQAGCDNCHNAGGQSPQFLRSDDVNQAYQQANGFVDRTNPSQSRLVTKVAGGHNCWLGNDVGSCASIMTRWITDWVGATDVGGRQIQLQEPALVDPGSSKRFPGADDPNMPVLFTPIYDKLDLWCSGCHQANSATAQSPYFAAGGRPEGAVDPTSDAFKQAYVAAVPKINLDDPAASRFVIRLRNEQHNCFNTCTADANELQQLIQAMADAIQPDVIPPGQVVSKAVTLYDGTLASGGNRYENHLIALYEFKAGQGLIAADTSGVAPAADLNLLGDVSWVGGYGINIRGGRAQATTTSSRKFQQLISSTGEYSIEAWVVPGNVTQEDARIVSYSGSANTRNFTMGQQLYNYEFFARSSATDGNGEVMLSTDDDAERLQASLQHVVMTFDPVNGRRIYVNGEFTGDLDGAGGGTIDSWDNSFAFVLGSEVGGQSGKWQGVIRLVAIHNRAMTQPQVQQNFDAGVGQKFFVLFGISHIINVPRSYIVFEAEQYDSFSYLFNRPKYFSLDAQAMPGNIPLKGMRIGVNGAEPHVGQAYRLLDTAISDTQYSFATGQLLSSVGTIIPVEQGPESDEFYLCFDQLGTASNACAPFTPGVAPAPVFGPDASEIGVKLFDAINATMASITGVSPNVQKVKDTYNSVRQSLPAVHDIKGYLSSHQTSVAQLALQYCNVLVDDPGLRSQFFGGGVDFAGQLAVANTSPVNDVGDMDLTANGTAVVNVLHSNGVGAVRTQPDAAGITADVGNLIKTLCAPAPLGTGATCGGERTEDVIKAACGATLGSAATVVQ